MPRKNKKLTFKVKGLKSTNYTPPPVPQPENSRRSPYSLVFLRGQGNDDLKHLVDEFQSVMKPNTYSVQVPRTLKINELMTLANHYKVTHLLIFSMTEEYHNLKILKTPSGPTLYFKIHEYVLGKDIRNAAKNYSCNYLYKPLIVLKGFSKKASLEVNLLGKALQGMFLELDVNNVHINQIQRCIFFHYDHETELINVRNYVIKIKDAKVSKIEKKIMKHDLFEVDMSKSSTTSNFFDSHALSGSETECEYPSIELPSKSKTLKHSIKLREIGPRMTIELIKIEAEVLKGEVLFHKHRTITLEEKRVIEKERFEKRNLKQMRIKIQNENVRKKEALKQLNKKKALEGMEKKRQSERDQALIKAALEGATQKHDDDVDWYKQEVGQAPEPDLFIQQAQNKNKIIDKEQNYKKVKLRVPPPPKSKKTDDNKEESNSKSRRKKGPVKGSGKPNRQKTKDRKGPGKSEIKKNSSKNKKKVGSKVSGGKRY